MWLSEVEPTPTPTPAPTGPAEVIATLAPEQWDVLWWGLGVICFSLAVLIALRF